MKLKLVLLIFGVIQIFANNSTDNECYDPREDDSAFTKKMLFTKLINLLDDNKESNQQLKAINTSAFTKKMLFTKLNNLLDDNKELNQQLKAINTRFDQQEERSELLMNNMNDKIKNIDENINLKFKNMDENNNLKFSTIDENINLKFRNIDERLNEHDSVSIQLTNGISLINKTMEKVLVRGPNNGWTVIQRRQDGSVDFYRDWNDYKMGFGNPNGEFFIGLERLHEMTTYGPSQQLLIVLQDYENNTRYAKYDNFQIGNETEKYVLKELGTYNGTAGDSLIGHKGYKFTTKDQDNDVFKGGNCANSCKGGWWYETCYYSNLNGQYSIGVKWGEWKRNYSFKFVEMKIRSSS